MKSSLRLLCLCGLAPLALAQQPAPPAAAAANPAPGTVLDTLTVYGEAENDAVIQPPFPLAVEGDKIFVGKRATIIDLDALPKVQANNYRQALALTPGLLFSEETTPLVSIGYRGIGEPHRMQFMQVLKDGIPIHADPFGYPEAYYTPPLDTVDRIEFIRGGGSLMYGPQPGGAFNYVTYLPQRESPFAFRTQNIYGSDELFSSYSAVDGTIGQLGYLGYFNHREWQGFRQANSQYKLNGGHGKLVWSIDDDTRLIFGFDGYEEEHGEPGGLTRRDFARNPEKTTRLHDEFRLRRYAGTLELQHRIQPGTELNIKTWGGYYQRWSKRQRTSGPLFGARPTGANAATNTIENQEFYTFGFEPRLRHDWEAWGGQHTLAAGMQFYYADSPREDQRGSSPDAEDGVTTLDSDRSTTYGSFFAENKFTFGRFSITPGFRLEMIEQQVRNKNYNATTGIFTGSVDKRASELQPLFGLGMALDFDNQTQLYANVSQSYRTTIFTESIIAQPGLTATDTDPSLGWSYELGYRGTPREWLAFDTSLFLIDLDNRFGVAGGRLRSVGRSINYGWDGAVQFDLIGGLDAARGTKLGDSLGALNLYGNVSLLEAELYGGPNNGATPQYAPDFILRTGLIYQRKGVKVSFLGTFVDDHNARDDGNPNFAIPGYMTWDLTAEVPVTKHLTLMAGVNNVFDESYYSRVRNDGIDPGYGRNFYVGGSVQF
jgi:Fe(3+) dicitrate transport protein